MQMRWAYAEQSSVIRSAEKDRHYQAVLREMVETELQAKFRITDTGLASALSQSVYLALTTLVGEKTLGEEYCSILQVDSRQGGLPGWLKRLAVALEPVSSLLLDDKWSGLLSSLGALYMSLFYFSFSKSYHPVKLLAGLRYIYHPRRIPKSGGPQPYRRLYFCLGAASLLIGLSRFLSSFRQVIYTQRSEKTIGSNEPSVRQQDACPLCMAKRTDSTRLPCGHVFCWECICRWLHHKRQCPICRKDARHADLLLLHNI